MFILDSSAIIEVVHDSELGRKVVNIVGSEKVYITSISVHEILLSEKYAKKVAEFAENSYVFNFNKESAKISAKIQKELKSSGRMINQGDIFIAAICIETNSTLVACDNDFKKIAGLKCTMVD